MRILSISVLVMFLAAVMPAAAQDDANLARTYFLTVKPPNALAFEQAYAKHIAYHEKNNDTWTWECWEKISGTADGNFIMRTPGHKWSDFDNSPLGAADREEFLRSTARYVESVDSVLTRLLPDLSHAPEDLTPPPMISVYRFQLVQGGMPDFVSGLKKAREAITESKWPGQYLWIQVLNGGPTPSMILVLMHDSWADVAGPTKPFWLMMEETVGSQETTRLQELFNGLIVSQDSAMYRYRPKLSYVPSP